MCVCGFLAEMILFIWMNVIEQSRFDAHVVNGNKQQATMAIHKSEYPLD